MRPAFASLVLAVLASACTNELRVAPEVLDQQAFDAQKPPAGEPVAVPRAGVPYYLPATALAVTVDYTITGCKVTESGGLSLDVSAKPQVKAERVPDRMMAFVIDMQSLQAPLKHSTITVKRNPDGTLASLNAESTDRTGEALVALVKTGLSVARLRPERGLKGFRGLPSDPCGKMNRAIGKRHGLTTEIARLEQGLKETLAKEQLTDADKQRIAALERRIKAKKAILAQHVATTSLHLEKRVVPRPPAFSETIVAQQAGIDRLAFDSDDLKAEAAKRLAVDLRVDARQNGALGMRPEALGTSVVYREPGPAKVTLTCAECRLKGEGDNPGRLLGGDFELAQFGRLYSLPFRNDVFDDNVLTASFDKLGFLSEAKYTSEANVVRALGAAEQSAAAIEAKLKARGAEEVAEAKNEADLLEQKIRKIELEKQLMALEALE